MSTIVICVLTSKIGMKREVLEEINATWPTWVRWTIKLACDDSAMLTDRGRDSCSSLRRVCLSVCLSVSGAI